jgi:hypothetical protein
MIRVGDKGVPFFDMNSTGVVVSFETSGPKHRLLTTEGTTSMIRIALVKMDKAHTDHPSGLRKFKVDDLLKADQ